MAEHMSITINIHLDGPDTACDTTTFVLEDILEFDTTIRFHVEIDRNVKFSAFLTELLTFNIWLDLNINTNREFALGDTILSGTFRIKKSARHNLRL